MRDHRLDRADHRRCRRAAAGRRRPLMAARVPRQERGEQRRDALLAAAVAVVAAGGPRRSRPEAVAAQARLPLAAVSYYFPRLDDLLGAAIAVVVDGWSIRARPWSPPWRRPPGRAVRSGPRPLSPTPCYRAGAGAAIRHRYEHLLAAASYPIAAAAMTDLRPRLACWWSGSCAAPAHQRHRGGRVDRAAGRGRDRRGVRGRGADPAPPARPDSLDSAGGAGHTTDRPGSADPIGERPSRDPFVGLDIAPRWWHRRHRRGVAAAGCPAPGPSRTRRRSTSPGRYCLSKDGCARPG